MQPYKQVSIITSSLYKICLNRKVLNNLQLLKVKFLDTYVVCMVEGNSSKVYALN